MPDLSKLLGDVYGSTPAPHGDDADGLGADDGTRAEAPDWADEDLLDRAFEGWVAGPPQGAPSVERSMLTEVADEPPPAPPRVDEARVERINRIVPIESLLETGAEPVDVVTPDAGTAATPADESGATAIESVAATPVVAEPAEPRPEAAAPPVGGPVEVQEPAGSPAWDRSQDDILPRRGARGVRRRS